MSKTNIPTKPLILVADDDDFMLDAITMFLTNAGYEVIETANGQEAFQAFVSRRPDLVLLDGQMPVMDGFEACRRIKADTFGAQTPVIMITALDDDQSVNNAFLVGAQEFITKPILWSVLKQRIRLLLDQKSANAAIRERDELIAVFFEHTPTAVAMFDPEMKYLLASQRWLKDYNLEGKPIIGKSHYKLLPNEPSRWQDIHKSCLKGNIERSEAELIDDNWYRWEALPWQKKAEDAGGILMFTENITPQKEMEDEIKAHRDRLTFEREIIEEIINKMRASKRFDPTNLRYIQASAETSSGDLLLSAFRSDGAQHVVLGDFTGHGLPAAVGGPIVSDIFYSMTKKEMHLSRILLEINDQLVEKTPVSMFMAAGFLELDPERRTLTVWNCAIPSILIYRNKKILHRVESGYMAPGMMSKTNSNGVVFSVEPGDVVIAYTDGFMEETGEDGEMFGQKKFELLISKMLAHEEPMETLTKTLKCFRTGHDQSDDMTILELTC
ncbi:MAG: SpoIIE family protein phosphatase [Magnetococcales bacterium]|nr:SpoIIE family protein phosphatase [Magnetococcales bacterium]